MNTPAYYDNSKGTLYKVAGERGWNAYLFDIVKRLERGGKKDPLRTEIEKSIVVLKLWLEELPDLQLTEDIPQFPMNTLIKNPFRLSELEEFKEKVAAAVFKKGTDYSLPELLDVIENVFSKK